MKRKIQILSTSSLINTTLETEVTTKGELDKVLMREGKSTSGFKFMTTNKLSLERSDSKLPEGDHTLIAVQIKNKAGSDHAELKAKVKELRLRAIEEEDEKAVQIFSNYPQKNSEQLKEMLKQYEEHKKPKHNFSEELSGKINSLTKQVEVLEEKTSKLKKRVLEIEVQTRVRTNENAEEYDAAVQKLAQIIVPQYQQQDDLEDDD